MTKHPRTHIPDFEPLGHIYMASDGMILPSVTTILKEELGLYSWGSSSAATRGTHVHLACQYYDEGNLDEATVRPEIQPYLAQYKLALQEHGITVLQNELRRYSPKYLFAGSIDKVVEISGRRAILDIKTGSKEHWHRWQTAGYKELMAPELGQSVDRYDLYLSPDDSELVQHQGKRDFGEFMAFLSTYTIKGNTGYRKTK